MVVHIDLSYSSTSSSPVLAHIGSGEVALIELQGSLDVVEGEKCGGFIGKLIVDNEKASLKVGHHLLEGKVTTLSKPLAVLRSKNKEEDEHDDLHTGGAAHYQIMTVVKKKILFAKRPVPIVINRV